jgi:hypothetical protein
MSTKSGLPQSDTTYKLNVPASEEAVTALRAQFPHLPDDYFSFLLRSDGGEGFLGISPGYFALWSAHEVVKFSTEYEVPIYLPGYVAVGSNGGGELYVFPISGWPSGIFTVPAIGMAPDVVDLVARNFSAFVAEFGGEWKVHA